MKNFYNFRNLLENFIICLTSGIVCRSAHGGVAKGEPLVVADVRRGSPAHRSGAIHVGDRVQAIDGIPLATCTVAEAMRLLQCSGPVVKLALLKGGGDVEEEAEGLEVGGIYIKIF
jgi:C-terminal processing protease CtpA/Prc